MQGEIEPPQDDMYAENTDTQEVTCHVVEAEVHAAHGHMSDSTYSWLNFSSQNDLDVAVPAERSFDRNLFEFLNNDFDDDDDDDDDLGGNRLAATNGKELTGTCSSVNSGKYHQTSMKVKVISRKWAWCHVQRSFRILASLMGQLMSPCCPEA